MLYVVSKVTTQGQDLEDYLAKSGLPNENSGAGERGLGKGEAGNEGKRKSKISDRF